MNSPLVHHFWFTNFSYWCLVCREWMGCWGLLGVAGMMTLLVINYESFSHSLRLAPVSSSPIPNWCFQPPWKIWVRHLRDHEIPNRWKVIKFHGSSHHQPGEIAVFRVYVSWIATNSWPSQNISKSYSWNSSKFDFPTNPPVSKNYHAWSCFVLIFADDPSIW